MISAETIAELEARGLLYVPGVRERTDKLVRDLVLDDPAPFVPLVLTKRNNYSRFANLTSATSMLCMLKNPQPPIEWVKFG